MVALEMYLAIKPNSPTISVAGGVASNSLIRDNLKKLAAKCGVTFIAPPINLCTDNAAMIAWAGIEHYRLGARDDMSLGARPRWPLDESAPALIGYGKKGRKA